MAYDSVDVVLSDTDVCPFDMGTFGSMNVPVLGPALRGAGAEARAVLLQMASERLQIPVGRLQVKAGVVSDPAAPGKSVTYGQLVEGKRIERHLERVPVKPVKAYTVVGRPAARKDGLEKVSGKAKYAADFAFPGLLHARMVKLPAYGAKMTDVDTSAAEKFGARVVKDGDMVAVLHERPDLADRALGLVKAQFDRPPASVDDKSIFDHLLKTAPQFEPAGERGSGGGRETGGGHRRERLISTATWRTPHGDAFRGGQIEDGKVTVWASTQAPFSVRGAVAQALGVSPENVRVVAPAMWAADFGGKSAAAAGRGCRAPGKDHGQARAGGAGPRRGVLLRHLPSGGGGEDPLGPQRRGQDRLVGLPGVGRGQRRGPHSSTTCPTSARRFAGGWQGGNPPGMHPFGVGPWRAPSANTQHVRARIAHGRPGGQGR